MYFTLLVSKGQTMKTTLTKFAVVTLAIALFTLPAHVEASQFRGADGGTCLNMIDTDGDGIGDTRPEPGTGVGAAATNFVDADENGLCDTYEAGGQQLLDGSGSLDATTTRIQTGARRGRN